MSCMNRWLLCCLLAGGPAVAQTQTPNPPVTGTKIPTNAPRAVTPVPHNASESFAAQQKARQQEEAARERAIAEQAQRQQEERNRIEADRERELKRIELEILKAAEQRRLNTNNVPAPARALEEKAVPVQTAVPTPSPAPVAAP